MKSPLKLLIFLFLFGCFATTSFAQQKMDEEYAKLIKKYTTDPAYLNDWIDHLPASSKVPSPLDYFGTIAGAADTLHYTAEIYGYMRELEKTSPRVKIINIGTTEGGRDMLMVFIADEATLNNLDTYRGYLNQLSDPRNIDGDEAEEIISKAKPIYVLTAGLHSPETGSPEMVTELAYRLAVGTSPMIQKIRKNVIVAISPVTEPDGRDRVVDIYNWRDANNGVTPSLTYWGDYVAHDNNRDGYGLVLDLTKNILNFYQKWKPTVMHDLHESIPLLYIYTGHGAFNPYSDPTLVSSLYKLAFNDVAALTKLGMPGVWTYGFMDGWSANYLAWFATNRNSIGRFYETFGNSIPQTVEREISDTTRTWFRQDPSSSKVLWSLRNNTNYMETAVLASLKYAAHNGSAMVNGFYHRSKQSIQKGKTQAPYAFVIPKNQRRRAPVVRLINMLRENGVEIHEVNESLKWKGGSVEDGAYIVRMDQPYRAVAGLLLDVQDFPQERFNSSYDAVGWTLPYLYQIQSYIIEDPNILEEDMNLLAQDIELEGGVTNGGSDYLLLNNTAVNQIGMFRLQLSDIPMDIAEASFEADNQTYASGSLILSTGDLSNDQLDKIEQKATNLGLNLYGVSEQPNVAVHAANTPKVALVHTWIPTPQNTGWWRFAFDELNIPYQLISTQDFKDMDANDYDVIIMPDTRASTKMLVNGTSKVGPPVPWMKSELTPNLGKIDQTKDQRQGMTYEGVLNLKAFLNRGGVLITEAGAANLPIDLGFAQHISIQRAPGLITQGSIFEAVKTDSTSPIMYGYVDTLGVLYNQRSVFKADTTAGGFRDYMTPDWLSDLRWQKTYPRVVMRFNKNQKELLLSGMLKGGKALAGAPAVIDVPVGEGHVVMIAPKAFWRWETHGTHALVFNTLMNWDDLRTGWPERPKEEEDSSK